MNALSHFELDEANRKSPADLAITVRDARFGRGEAQARWWLNGDPVATAWFNALSATFPRGETLFIDAVKAFREGAPPQLAAEIGAFIRQEANHTREHLAFNRAAEAAGYDMRKIDAWNETANDAGGMVEIETQRREQVERKRHRAQQIAVKTALIDERAPLLIGHFIGGEMGDVGR